MFAKIICFAIMFSCVNAQTENLGTCKLWGDPHLICFPADVQESDYRPGYWCQWHGRMLVVKNTFMQLYVNFTASPYWNEYYELYLFYNGSKICTITPDINNCSSPMVHIISPRTAPNNKQIFYDYNEPDHLQVVINSQLVNGRFVAYNIEVTQSYDLIQNSTGLCINRARQCEIESVGRRKRSTSVNKATEVCNLFINKAQDAVRQLVSSSNTPMINHAREACITDILTTNDPTWGESVAWFVIHDYIREAPLSRTEREEIASQVPILIAATAASVKSAVEVILEISTTTSLWSNTTSAAEIQATSTTSTNTDRPSPSQVSESFAPSDTLKLKLNLILLSSMIFVVYLTSSEYPCT